MGLSSGYAYKLGVVLSWRTCSQAHWTATLIAAVPNAEYLGTRIIDSSRCSVWRTLDGVFAQTLAVAPIPGLRPSHTMRVATTRYVSQTSTKPSRVSAKNVTTKKRCLMSWDHELNELENHTRVATEVLGRAPEWHCSVEGGGYLFGVNPASDPVEDECPGCGGLPHPSASNSHDACSYHYGQLFGRGEKPSDYESCGECGFDHSYEQDQAIKAHNERNHDT